MYVIKMYLKDEKNLTDENLIGLFEMIDFFSVLNILSQIDEGVYQYTLYYEKEKCEVK